MAAFEQLFQDLGRMSYDEKVSSGRRIYEKIVSIIDQHKYGYFFVPARTVAIWYYAIFCGVDRKIKFNEHEYYIAISNNDISYNGFFKECTECNHPELRADLKMFMKKISYDEVGYFQTLAALIFSLKGNPTYEEKMYLINFFN